MFYWIKLYWKVYCLIGTTAEDNIKLLELVPCESFEIRFVVLIYPYTMIAPSSNTTPVYSIDFVASLAILFHIKYDNPFNRTNNFLCPVVE